MAPRRKFIVTALILLAAPIFVLCGALWSVPDSVYLRFIESSAVPALRKKGVLLSWGAGTIDPFALTLRRIDLSVPSRLLVASADECHAQISPWRLLMGTVRLDLRCTAYAGEAQMELTAPLYNQRRNAQVKIRSIDIARHPQFRALGFRSALLSVDAPAITLSSVGSSGRVQLNLETIEKPEESVLSPLFTGFPAPIKLPPLRDGKLSLPLQLEGNRIVVSGLEFSSSLGECTGDYEFSPNLTRGTFIVSLRPEGSAALGPWLPVVSGGVLNTEDRRFSVSFSGNPRTLRPRFKKG